MLNNPAVITFFSPPEYYTRTDVVHCCFSSCLFGCTTKAHGREGLSSTPPSGFLSVVLKPHGKRNVCLIENDDGRSTCACFGITRMNTPHTGMRTNIVCSATALHNVFGSAAEPPPPPKASLTGTSKYKKEPSIHDKDVAARESAATRSRQAAQEQ